MWVDDPHFNLGYHVRHTAIPPPGDEEQLRRLVGRLMSQQLDRHKPLWEMWMIEGLSDGRWALISKIHHCMVDGVSGTDLLTVLLDEEREPARDARQEAWHPGPEPGGAELLARRARRAGHEPGGGAARGRALAGVPARARPRDARHPAGPRGPALADPAHAGLDAQRPDRPAPALGVGASAAVGRQGDPRGARRHGQRRRARRDHAGLPRAAARARRGRRGPPRADAGSGLGPRGPTSAAPTTTASRRCSPSCPWASPTRSPA